MDKREIIASECGERLDSFLASQIEDTTRSAVTALIENGEVTVNGTPQKKNYKLKVGDVVSLTIPDPVPLDVEPEDIPLEVLFEDEHL